MSLVFHKSFYSNPQKYLQQRAAMDSYRNGNGHSIVCTHISPTARCNLKCAYCSYADRARSEEIPLETIKAYVTALRERGLKGAILSGGGEPTLYPQFNELVLWLKEQGLKLGLITNGTQVYRVSTWGLFEWIRISVNFRDGWLADIGNMMYKLIDFPVTVGISHIVTDEGLHEDVGKLGYAAKRVGAKYIRLLPDCLLPERRRGELTADIEAFIARRPGERYFVQHKVSRKPNCDVCHQAYFRPYLSEYGGGSVWPCDVSILAGPSRRLNPRHMICKAEDVLQFLDRETPCPVVPKRDCPHCVFGDTIEMLDVWVSKKEDRHAVFL